MAKCNQLTPLHFKGLNAPTTSVIAEEYQEPSHDVQTPVTDIWTNGISVTTVHMQQLLQNKTAQLHYITIVAVAYYNGVRRAS